MTREEVEIALRQAMCCPKSPRTPFSDESILQTMLVLYDALAEKSTAVSDAPLFDQILTRILDLSAGRIEAQMCSALANDICELVKKSKAPVPAVPPDDSAIQDYHDGTADHERAIRDADEWRQKSNQAHNERDDARLRVKALEGLVNEMKERIAKQQAHIEERAESASEDVAKWCALYQRLERHLSDWRTFKSPPMDRCADDVERALYPERKFPARRAD